MYFVEAKDRIHRVRGMCVLKTIKLGRIERIQEAIETTFPLMKETLQDPLFKPKRTSVLPLSYCYVKVQNRSFMITIICG